jgi:23S rRNA (adenine2503-C2)-methyltransferase
MPINRRYPLEILRESLRDFPLNKRGVFFIEYVLIAGVNDTRAMAANLAEFLKGLPVRVNLIPLNQSPLLPYVSPSPEQVERFRLWLVEEDLFVRLRQPHGQGVCAACGQLGAWGGATP